MQFTVNHFLNISLQTSVSTCTFEGEEIPIVRLCNKGNFVYRFEIKTKILKTGESLLISDPIGNVVCQIGVGSLNFVGLIKFSDC